MYSHAKIAAHRKRACSISAGGKHDLTNQGRGEEVGRKKSRWRTYRFECYIHVRNMLRQPHLLHESVVCSKLLSPRYPRSHAPFSLLAQAIQIKIFKNVAPSRSNVNVQANAKWVESTVQCAITFYCSHSSGCKASCGGSAQLLSTCVKNQYSINQSRQRLQNIVWQ